MAAVRSLTTPPRWVAASRRGPGGPSSSAGARTGAAQGEPLCRGRASASICLLSPTPRFPPAPGAGGASRRRRCGADRESRAAAAAPPPLPPPRRSRPPAAGGAIAQEPALRWRAGRGRPGQARRGGAAPVVPPEGQGAARRGGEAGTRPVGQRARPPDLGPAEEAGGGSAAARGREPVLPAALPVRGRGSPDRPARHESAYPQGAPLPSALAPRWSAGPARPAARPEPPPPSSSRRSSSDPSRRFRPVSVTFGKRKAGGTEGAEGQTPPLGHLVAGAAAEPGSPGDAAPRPPFCPVAISLPEPLTYRPPSRGGPTTGGRRIYRTAKSSKFPFLLQKPCKRFQGKERARKSPLPSPPVSSGEQPPATRASGGD